MQIAKIYGQYLGTMDSNWELQAVAGNYIKQLGMYRYYPGIMGSTWELCEL